jgi:hypothetical protein
VSEQTARPIALGLLLQELWDELDSHVSSVYGSEVGDRIMEKKYNCSLRLVQYEIDREIYDSVEDMRWREDIFTTKLI